MRTTFEANSTFWPDLWKAAYRLLHQKMTAEMISAWIDSLELDRIDESSPVIQVHFLAPNDFQYTWVKEKYLNFLSDSFSQVAGKPCEIHLSVAQKDSINGPKNSPNPLPRDPSVDENRYNNSSSLKEDGFSSLLLTRNPPSTLENTERRLLAGGESAGPEGFLPSQDVASDKREQTAFSYLKINEETTSAGSDYSVQYANQRSALKRGGHSNDFETESGAAYDISRARNHAQPEHNGINSLDPRYDFTSFIVGASNQFAHASAIAVAENPARQYNPLLIYSQSGLGKTHLLHAIGNYAKKKNSGLRVGYFSAETFVNDVIDSIKHNKMSDFRHKYRESFDLILMDDIQFLAGKERSEEEFFHTFNALHTTKRQVVVTSDRDPKDLDKLESRLRSRLGWGLVADIRPPEIETRIAILRAKADRDDIYLLDEVATYIATHIKSNVRELEGILVKLEAQASLSGSEISLEMAKNLLSHLIPEESSDFTVESIQNTVSRFFNIKIVELRSSSRLKKIALGRQISMFLIRRYTGLQYGEIGQHFGGRDHTTVMHSCKKIEYALETDAEVKELVEQIQNQL